MTKTLYLHVGMHKTGTTSIQYFCWKNRFSLKDLNFLYPELGLSGPTHAHFALCLPGDRQKILKKICYVDYSAMDSPYKKYTGFPPEILYKQLGEAVQETSCDNILLSSECFLEWIDPGDVARLIDRYVHCKVKIIIYLRRQDQWIQAVFNQIVKDPYIRYVGKLEEMPQIEMMDYYETISKWANRFGRKNILVRIYEKQNLHAGNIIVDLLTNFGLAPEDFSGFPALNEEANMGINWEGLKLLHSLNRHHASDSLYRKVLNLLSSRVMRNYDTPSQNALNFEDAIKLYEKYKSSNERVSKDYCDGKRIFDPPTRHEYIGSGLSPEDIFSEILIDMFESKIDKVNQ